jgi:hypothetical protein
VPQKKSPFNHPAEEAPKSGYAVAGQAKAEASSEAPQYHNAAPRIGSDAARNVNEFFTWGISNVPPGTNAGNVIRRRATVSIKRPFLLDP